MRHKQMFLNCQIKQLTEPERIISGYASTWGLDSVRDKIRKGAFDRSIKERFENQVKAGKAPKIKVLYQHDPREPVGVPTLLKEDAKGLYFEAKISNTRLGNEILEMVKDGTLSSMSIGFQIVKDDFDTKENIRYIDEAKLIEFSFVTFPANEEAVIMRWKNLFSIEEEIETRVKELVENIMSNNNIKTNGLNLNLNGEITSVGENPDSDELNLTSTTFTCNSDNYSEMSLSLSPESAAKYTLNLDTSVLTNEIKDILEQMVIDKLNEEDYIEKVGRTLSRRNEQILREIVEALSPLKALLDSLEVEEIQEALEDEENSSSEEDEEEVNEELAENLEALNTTEESNETPLTESEEGTTENLPDIGDAILQDLQNVDWGALLATSDNNNNLPQDSGGNSIDG